MLFPWFSISFVIRIRCKPSSQFHFVLLKGRMAACIFRIPFLTSNSPSANPGCSRILTSSQRISSYSTFTACIQIYICLVYWRWICSPCMFRALYLLLVQHFLLSYLAHFASTIFFIVIFPSLIEVGKFRKFLGVERRNRSEHPN